MATEITEFEGGEYYHMISGKNKLILKAKGSGINVVCYSLSTVDTHIKKYSEHNEWCARKGTHKGLREATSDEIRRLNKCIDAGEYVPEDDTPEITEFIYNEYYHMKLSGGGYVIFKSKSEKTSKHVFGISTNSHGDYRRDGGWNIKYCHEGLRKATPDEIQWLDVCISNDKFIPNAMVIKETIVEGECKFKVGDKVKRISNTHQGMVVGDVSTITSIEKALIDGKFTFKLADYPYGHSYEMFELYTGESKYLNASQLVVGEVYRHDVDDDDSFIFQFKDIIEASDCVKGFCCYSIDDRYEDDMYSIGIGSAKFSAATDSEKGRLIGKAGYRSDLAPGNKGKAGNVNFKVGDKVKITCNKTGHYFDVGEVVTITNVNSSGYDGKSSLRGPWAFTDSEAEAYQYRSGPPAAPERIWTAAEMESMVGFTHNGSWVKAGEKDSIVDEMVGSEVDSVGTWNVEPWMIYDKSELDRQQMGDDFLYEFPDEFPASITLKLGGKKDKVKFIPYMEEEEDNKEIELTFKSL